MKKIFFFALASLALASCSQDEEFVAEKTNGSNRADKSVLSFSTYTAGGTRATDVTSTDIKKSKAEDGGFQVAAWYDGKLYFKDNALFENGLAIDTDDKIDNAFDTEGDTYWWPGITSTNKIGFRAFNNGVGADWNVDYESLKFTVASTAATQKDLVIAYAETGEKPADGVQPLNFTHALSKVNFTFVGSNEKYTYTINKVEVIAAGQDDAVMSFEETTELGAEKGTTDGSQPNTNAQADKVSWDFTAINGDNALVEKEATAGAAQGVLYTYYDVAAGSTAAAMNENFMLLPQSGKIAVRVYYKVEDAKGKLIGNCGFTKTDAAGRHDGQNDADYEAGSAIYGFKTAIITLGSTDVPAWEAGKAYRFTMTLPADNFIGDRSGDKVPDGLDSTDPSNPVDLDGDGDTHASEFDQLTPIRFSVTVSAWETAENNTNITIK